jgi:cation diffusion facilitator CzcD-associated flavoprotein CzcO
LPLYFEYTRKMECMNMVVAPDLPVAVIGAGPVGLAAAAHLVSRGLRPLVLEKGASVGASLLEWGHVRVFSPWRYNIDAAARLLLQRTAWREPAAEALPTGGEIVRDYLAPLAAVPEIASNLKLGATVAAITRQGHDKVSSRGREDSPFVVHYQDKNGEHRVLARPVLDASGTWARPTRSALTAFRFRGRKRLAAGSLTGFPT